MTVTAPVGCTWSTTASATWISVTAGSSGTGPGTVTYTVAANPATESRSGSLMIEGQSHGISQQGRAPTICSYVLSPASAAFGKDGGQITFTVSAPDDCGWTAASSAPWLAVTGGSSGSGNGTVSLAVAPNSEIAARSATIMVADRGFAVAQEGDIGLCEYSVTPVEFSPCMPDGSVTATVTTQPDCPWTATPDVSWLSVPSGPSSTGSGNLLIAFSANYDAPRKGIVMVRWPTPTLGQNIHVAQAGCFYAVSRSAFAVGSSGGSDTFDVYQQSDPIACGGATQNACVWTARSDVPWITVTSSMPRAGDDRVAFTVAPTAGTAARVGTITVQDKVVTITQAGS